MRVSIAWTSAEVPTVIRFVTGSMTVTVGLKAATTLCIEARCVSRPYRDGRSAWNCSNPAVTQGSRSMPMERMFLSSCCGDSSKRKHRHRSPRRQAASRKWARQARLSRPGGPGHEDRAAAVVPLTAEHPVELGNARRYALQRRVMLKGQRGHGQHADAVGIDEEGIFVRAVVGAAVFDDAQAPRRDLIVDAMVEQNHRVRDVFLESLPGEGPLAALARDDGRDALLLQPAEQPSQLGAEDRRRSSAPRTAIRWCRGPRAWRRRADRITEPDEQPFEIVLAGLLDLAAFHAHVVDRQLLRGDQLGQVEAE